MPNQKKPWEAKVFATKLGQYLRSDRKDMVFSSFILSVLFSIFFLMIIGMLLIIYYTSNGGSETPTAREGFYKPDKVVIQKPAVETPQVEEPVEQEEEEVFRNGETITVLAGEGAASIAARAGISLERLYALNPDKMVGPDGTWWANPGDVVYID